jgi:glucose-1-phosphate adenylyltransferase
VIEVDADWRIAGFDEKPARPKSIPGEPDFALVSMGNYMFNSELLIKALRADAESSASNHDFGRDLIPSLVKTHRVYAYDFRKNRVPVPYKGEEASYWRDLGTIEAYYEASMDLCSVDPSFNLYNRSWPLRTVGYGDPPAKFVFDWYDRQGMALNSIVAEGTIISGSVVHSCVIGRNVRIHSYSRIDDAVIMDWAEIGRGCQIRRAIIDKSNVIPPGTRIGYDAREDRERYFVSDSGIVVIGRGEPKTNWITTSPL